MSNAFGTKSAETLVSIIDNVIQVAGDSPADYGWSAAQMTALRSAALLTSEAINSQKTAILNEKAATQNKKMGKEQASTLLNALATEAMADPEVTDGMLAQIGFAPRRSSVPRPMAVSPVTGFAAVPAVDGSVALSWDRGANPRMTMFVIEASADGASWRFLKTVTRVSATVDGFAPGVAAWFRVTATTSTTVSRPSAAVAIYAPSASEDVQLRVA